MAACAGLVLGQDAPLLPEAAAAVATNAPGDAEETAVLADDVRVKTGLRGGWPCINGSCCKHQMAQCNPGAQAVFENGQLMNFGDLCCSGTCGIERTFPDGHKMVFEFCT